MHKLYDAIELDEMNPDILSGISRILGRDTVGFVNDLWKQSLKALPGDMIEKEIIRYDGFSIVPIHERTMKERERVYSPGRKKDITPISYPINGSDSIPVRFKFSIKEGSQYIEAYINMRVPFIRRNGLTRFSGSNYYITPILSDVLITPDASGVFIKFDSIKFKVKTDTITILAREPGSKGFTSIHGSIIISDQMRGGIVKDKGYNPYGTPKVPVHLYVLYSHGLKDIYGEGIEIIHNNDVDAYSDKGWYIYGTPNTKPKGAMEWDKTEYYVAVKKEPSVTSLRIITSILQVVYFFPDSGFDMKSNINTKGEKGFWEVAIGRMIYKGKRSDTFMLREVRNTFSKFQTYINGRLASKLKDIGFQQTVDYFEFLKELLVKIDDMKANHLEYTNSFSYREIDIYYYLLYPYIEGINKIISGLSKAWKTKGVLTREQFYGITTKEYSNESLLRKIPKAPIALTLSKLEASSDNLAFKMTTIMIPQEVGKGVNRKMSNKNNKDIIPANMQGIYGSFAYIGTPLKLNSIPVALASLNVFVDITSKGKFKFDKKDIATMEAINIALNEQSRDMTNTDVLVDHEIEYNE